MNIIELDRLSRRFGDVAALDDVSLTLEENRIHGLLGRNGAGKTTLMQILTAQQFPTSGTVRVFGADPHENAAVLDRVCFIREAQRYPDSFKVKHAMEAGRVVFPHWDDALAADLVGEFGLRSGQRIRKLSRGQLSAVGVILGLASRASLTFFDEPYLGLDAVARQLFYDRLLADYADHPRTVVLSTHLIDEVSDLIEHVVVLDHGKVLLDGEADALRGSAIVVSGPAPAVADVVAAHEVLHREQLGAFSRTTIRVAGQPPAPGNQVTVEPISLQQLVVRTTQATGDNSGEQANDRNGKVLQS